MNADPLDLAFMAIGIDAAFRDPTTGDYDGGQLELVGEVLAYQSVLDAHYQAFFNPDGFPGCWAYEVAEPFGEWCARQLMAGTTPDTAAVNAWLDKNAPGEATRAASNELKVGEAA